VAPSRLGPLRERDFRLLFAGRTISTLGSAMAPVALAFAILDTLHRLRRNRLMVASNVVSGLSQGAVAVLLLTGHARLWELATFAAVNGASLAFFLPASGGVVPQTVSASLLQQANALLRLGLNTTNVAGAALGGIVVAAVALALMRLPAGPRVPGSSIVSELREGWSDFWSRSWLWGIVLQFCLLNAAAQAAAYVLGPAVAKRQLGGAAAWGVMLTATTAGLVLAGLLVLRWQPRRLLLVATVATFGVALLPLALARPLPLAAVIAAAFAAGVCLEIFEVLWQTAFQQEIPRDRLSRVTSYDAVGSFAALPIGLAAVGPIAAVAGVRATFLGAAVIAIVSTVLVLTLGEVRRLARAADGG
jgi:hypothetical protein